MKSNKPLVCNISKKCGGCAYIGRAYEYSLCRKQELVEKLLKGLVPQIDPVVPAQDPYFYRNKVNRGIGVNKNRKLVSGTYTEGRKDLVFPDTCYIEDKTASDLIDDICNIATSFRMSAYNDRTGRGDIRRVLVRVGKATGQIMVILVFGNGHVKGKNNLIKEIKNKHPEITSIYTNVNRRSDSLILDPNSPMKKESGKAYIEDILLGNTFRISPESFYQINRDQAEKLYLKALEYANIKPDEVVIDAYCGIGTITLSAAKLSDHVLGVDNNKKAIADAIDNARINKNNNASFIAKDATEYMENLAERKEHVDLVIMDPPRAGSTRRFISACKSLAPTRIVYVSCNPETLARDLEIFASQGYKAVKATPVDMFPFTDNLEVVVLLSRVF